MDQPVLQIENVSMSYSDKEVVKDLFLTLHKGQIGCLLGESGCGKTTLLRTIAGFEKVRAGSVVLNGQTVSSTGQQLPPAKRNIGMVFQDYALFPHLSVYENVAFGLKNLPKEARGQRVNETLTMVGLQEVDSKYPHELSGGQQQRVALARALAMRPRLLLMDEPFSNLDVSLRERLSMEVRAILKKCNTTALFVTHNQQEAFALADVIGVMDGGRLQQWDTGYNLYHKPRNTFVAGFVGEGSLLKAACLPQGGVATALGVLNRGGADHGVPENFEGVILIRPEDILHDDQSDLKAEVVRRTFRGPNIIYDLRLANNEILQALVPSYCDHRQGEKIGIRHHIRHMVLFHNDSGSLAACVGM